MERIYHRQPRMGQMYQSRPRPLSDGSWTRRRMRAGRRRACGSRGLSRAWIRRRRRAGRRRACGSRGLSRAWIRRRRRAGRRTACGRIPGRAHFRGGGSRRRRGATLWCSRFQVILTLPQFRPFLSDDRAAGFGAMGLARPGGMRRRLRSPQGHPISPPGLWNRMRRSGEKAVSTHWILSIAKRRWSGQERSGRRDRLKMTGQAAGQLLVGGLFDRARSQCRPGFRAVPSPSDCHDPPNGCRWIHWWARSERMPSPPRGFGLPFG